MCRTIVFLVFSCGFQCFAPAKASFWRPVLPLSLDLITSSISKPSSWFCHWTSSVFHGFPIYLHPVDMLGTHSLAATHWTPQSGLPLPGGRVKKNANFWGVNLYYRIFTVLKENLWKPQIHTEGSKSEINIRIWDGLEKHQSSIVLTFMEFGDLWVLWHRFASRNPIGLKKWRHPQHCLDSYAQPPSRRAVKTMEPTIKLFIGFKRNDVNYYSLMDYETRLIN